MRIGRPCLPGGAACFAACLVVCLTACLADDAFPDDGYGEGQVGAFQPALCNDPTQGPQCTRANSCGASLDLTYQGYCAPRCGSDSSCPSSSTCEGDECWLTCTPLPTDSCPKGFFCGLEVDGVTADGTPGPMLTCFDQTESG